MPKIDLKLFLLLLIFPFFMGTNACQENYNFASQSTVTDKDAPTVNFASETSSASEVGTVNVSVTLSAATDKDVEIPFTLSGTAVRPTDYTIDASPLVIAEGATSGDIAVEIVRTPLADEGDETVIVTLGSPTGGVLGTKTVHTLTISEVSGGDGEVPEVAFDELSDSVEEGEDLVIGITLSDIADQDLELGYLITGTGTSGTDYTIEASPLVITAGELTGELNLAPLADSIVDDLETVIITLQSSSDYTIGTNKIFTATIREPGSLSADSRTGAGTTTPSDLGQQILDGLLSLEGQQKNSARSNSGQVADKSNNAECNWIGGSEDSGCEDLDDEFVDADQDGYSDQLEEYFSSNPNNIGITPPLPKSRLSNRFAGVDSDLDGIEDEIERLNGTDDSNPDSDGDGIKDGLEDLAKSDPMDVNSRPVDADADGLSDEYELQIGTDLTSPDTNRDGVHDGLAVILGINPLKIDTDADGVSDFREIQIGSDPLTPDWQF